MNTPAHVIVNLLILGRQDDGKSQLAITAGAVLPDAPIMFFYAVEKLLNHVPEAVIWTERYYHAGWQNLIDTFHSLPLLIAGIGFAWMARSKVGLLILGSMGLHVLEDLPLHHDDAHRHLYPFSDWRFHSPVSYWDPSHYGTIVSQLEIAVVIIGTLVLLRRYRTWTGRTIVGSIGVIYALYFGYVALMWM